VPIVEPIFQASWQYHAPKTQLPPPSAAVASQLKPFSIDVNTGQRVGPSKTAFMEYFRMQGGRVRDTHHALVRGHVAVRMARPDEDRSAVYPGPVGRQAPSPPSRPPRTLRELFGLRSY
jgi:hypothetical protein